MRAFAEQAALRSHKLIMIGDGPERPAIEQLIRRHRLESCVELTGWKTQTEVAGFMREADIFAFPSIRELGAGAVVEAMACGLACVVVDYGGPGFLIDADRGVKIPLSDRDQLAREFGAALARLVTEEGASARLGAKAHDYVMREYTWDAKARKIISVYRRLLGDSGLASCQTDVNRGRSARNPDAQSPDARRKEGGGT